jgi:hypothetical protein
MMLALVAYRVPLIASGQHAVLRGYARGHKR